MKFLIGGLITVDLVFKMLITFFSKFIHDLHNCLYTLVIPSMTDHQMLYETTLIIEQLHLNHSKRKVTITKFLYIGTSTILCEVARKYFVPNH